MPDFWIELSEGEYNLNLDAVAQEAARRGHELTTVNGKCYTSLSLLEKLEMSARSCIFGFACVHLFSLESATAEAADIIATVAEANRQEEWDEEAGDYTPL